MKRTIGVFVGDANRRVGTLRFDEQGARQSAAFEYDPQFPDRQRELRTWISEDSGPMASIDALMSIVAYFRLEQESAVQILRQVERAVATWRIAGRRVGMSEQELERFADAFEHGEREVARSILRQKI